VVQVISGMERLGRNRGQKGGPGISTSHEKKSGGFREEQETEDLGVPRGQGSDHNVEKFERRNRRKLTARLCEIFAKPGVFFFNSRPGS